MKKSKWITMLCSATLLIQLSVVPALAISPTTTDMPSDITNEELTNTDPPVSNPDKTNTSSKTETPDVPNIESDNPLFSEIPQKVGDHHTYSWSSNVVIPNDDEKHLKQAEDAIKELAQTDLNAATNDPQKVLEAAYLLGMMPIKYDKMEDMRVKANLLQNLYVELDKIKDPEFKGKAYEVIVYLSLDWVLLTDDSQEFVNLSNALEKMPASEIKDKIQNKVDDIVDKNKPTDEDLNNGIPDKNKPAEGNPDDGKIDDGKTNDNDYIGGIKPPAKPPVLTLPEATYDYTKTVFNKNGCENTVYYYKDGKVIKKGTEKVDKKSCLSQSGKSNYKSANSVKYTGYNPYDKKQRLALLKNLQLKKELEEAMTSDLTVQYTFNKNDESPYYFDTGVNVNAKKELSYDQAKSALQIISIQAKGQFVEDMNQVLALVDGQIIRIEAYEGLKPFEEFKDNFKLTNIGVKLQDTRSSTKQGIIDLIEIKENHTIVYKDHPFALNERPIIDNNVVLFGAEQIAEILNIEIKREEKSKTIQMSLNGSIIEYTLDSSEALLNGEKIDLNVPVRFNKDMKYMIPITTLLNQLSLEIIVENEEIIIAPIKE
ncbi:stalk domain-containing protein [Lysinibacillus sp. UGB7]|uniref:stalk domain-containing protein n=1 Tax=Lysinibacillus sp. UGB7 TaxID=3411039 RepID=UPI003B8032F4